MASSSGTKFGEVQLHQTYICTGCHMGWHYACMSLFDDDAIDPMGGLWHKHCAGRCRCMGAACNRCEQLRKFTSCRVDLQLVSRETLPKFWKCLSCHSEALEIDNFRVRSCQQANIDLNMEVEPEDCQLRSSPSEGRMDLEKLTPTPFEGGTDPQKLTPTTKVLSGLVDQVSELKVQSPVPKEKQCTVPDSTRTRNDLQDQVKGSLSLLGEQISSSMEDDYPISKLIRKGKNLATQEAEESLVPVKQMEIEGEEAKKEKKKKRKKRFGKNWTSMIYTKWGKRGERSRRRYKSLQDVQEPFLVDENVEYSHIVGNRVSKEMVNEEDFTTDLANLEGWRKRRTAFPDSDDEEGTSLGGSGSHQETHLLHQVAKTGVQSERRVEGKDMKAIVIYSEPDVNLADPSHDQLESLTVPNRLQTSDNTSALMIIDSNSPQGLQNIKVLKKKQLRKPVQALAVTAPKSHFGPITADHDHKRRRGVLVGDIWDNRLSCRQWGVHLPPVSGIAGQSEYGAQSVCLSGSYDDEDHGDWFIYSGSGGKELIQSVNRSSPYYTKHQVKDQTFTSFNACLRLSCIEGLPVRVLRSYKFKSSPFAPDPKSLCYRYDGIYRVEKCWRIEKKSGLKVCRFLFLRCDNEPAPWKKSKDNVEKKVDFLNPREYFARLKLEAESILVKELDVSSELTERTAPPAWDWKNDKEEWGWVKDPPTRTQNRVLKIARRLNFQVKFQKHSKSSLALNEAMLCSFCNATQKLNDVEYASCGHKFCTDCQINIQTRSLENRSEHVIDMDSGKRKITCPIQRCKANLTNFFRRLEIKKNWQLQNLSSSMLQVSCLSQDNDDKFESSDDIEGDPDYEPNITPLSSSPTSMSSED